MNTFKVSDMSCAHCVARISGELEQLSTKVNVDLDTHSVTVDGNEQVVQKAKELVTGLGYTVEGQKRKLLFFRYKIGQNRNMKRILNVMNLKTELDKQKIEAELELTRLTFTVSLANQCVIVDGDADEVRVAKHAIEVAGYQVK